MRQRVRRPLPGVALPGVAAAVVAAPAVAAGCGPGGSGPAPTRMADLPDRSHACPGGTAAGLAGGAERHRGLRQGGGHPRRGGHARPGLAHHGGAGRARAVRGRRGGGRHRLAGGLQLPVGVGERAGAPGWRPEPSGSSTEKARALPWTRQWAGPPGPPRRSSAAGGDLATRREADRWPGGAAPSGSRAEPWTCLLTPAPAPARAPAHG